MFILGLAYFLCLQQNLQKYSTQPQGLRLRKRTKPTDKMEPFGRASAGTEFPFPSLSKFQF